jgi:hypothetical protein
MEQVKQNAINCFFPLYLTKIEITLHFYNNNIHLTRKQKAIH